MHIIIPIGIIVSSLSGIMMFWGRIKDSITKHIKEDIVKLDTYCQNLDGKVQKVSGRVSNIEGRLESK